MKYSKIKSLKKISAKPIYHLTVKKNQNFFGNNICLHNCNYRGELKVRLKELGGPLFNFDKKQYEIGDRIAQLIIMPIPEIQFLEVDELSETERGSGGFGSTGS